MANKKARWMTFGDLNPDKRKGKRKPWKRMERICKRTFQTQGRLHMTRELWGYLDALLALYGRMFRRAWHALQGEPGISESGLRTAMQKEFNVSKRSADAALRDAKGRIAAEKEKRKTEISTLRRKIKAFSMKLEVLKQSVNARKPDAAHNRMTDKQMAAYRRDKANIHQKAMKLDRMKARLAELEGRKKEKLCFGTKKLFRAQYFLEENGLESHAHWLRCFRRKRDSRALFLGEADKPSGNDRARLVPYGRTGYTLYLKKEYCLGGGNGTAGPPGTDAKNWVCAGRVEFPHMADALREAVRKHEAGARGKPPLTATVRRKGGKWLVDVALTEEIRRPSEWRSDSFHGCFGIDFNEGFVEIVETDGSGNMTGAWKWEFRHQARNSGRALDEMRVFAKNMAEEALRRHKDIWIEGLDFRGKKAKTTTAVSKAGKKYNRMIHSLAYKRFRECLEAACFHRKVHAGTVDPAYTSIIGGEKFAGRMKVTVHRAAAFVIARRGMGIRDRRPGRTARRVGAAA